MGQMQREFVGDRAMRFGPEDCDSRYLSYE